MTVTTYTHMYLSDTIVLPYDKHSQNQTLMMNQFVFIGRKSHFCNIETLWTPYVSLQYNFCEERPNNSVFIALYSLEESHFHQI